MDAANAELRQFVYWLATVDDLRELFFTDPATVFAFLDRHGLTLSETAQRRAIARLTPETFDEEFRRFFPQRIDRTRPPANVLGLPAAAIAELTPKAANGGSASPDEPAQPPARVVNTGFSSLDQPASRLDRMAPLATGAEYYFYLYVGEYDPDSIEETPTPLPDELPSQAILDVVLFGFQDELAIRPGHDVGQLQIKDDGSVGVVRRVAEPVVDENMLDQRLFFPVGTPARPGVYRLRCNIYYQQTLVQSRLVTAHVGQVAPAGGPALSSALDYTLSHSLDADQLALMGTNRLSIMLNSNGTDTHGFRFFGEAEFVNTAAFGEGELSDLIEKSRGAMRKAAWGDEEEFTADKKNRYRYENPLPPEESWRDLRRFALRGRAFYTSVIRRLAGGVVAAKSWEPRMLRPGQVQLASKQLMPMVVPLAILYDYPLKSGLELTAYSLCPAFVDARQGTVPLEETACFQGQCPTYDERQTICPSGFWGFRHSLGLPVSVRHAPDAPATIPCPDRPVLAVGVSTDPEFIEREGHERVLRAMGFGWERADTPEETLSLLKRTKAHLVYFYCHGGVASTGPFIEVGPPNGDRIDATSLYDEDIFWQTPRPLVVINGCHTTDLSPESALNLVDGFVTTSQAAGVIGTEITIFEPIAVAFAEECFRRFLKERQTIGEAVRGARLKMLKEGNPLGLVYIPFVLPGLRLSRAEEVGGGSSG